MENGRKNCPGKKVLNGPVGESGAKALSVTLSALSIAWFAVLGLAHSGQETVPGNLDIVERAAGYHFEFLADRERGNMLGLHGQKVWQGKKKPVI